MIPKVIHYCWFGGKELPEEVLRCIESWKKFCPDYEIRRWDESNYDYQRLPFTAEAYRQKKWAFVSDVARLEIVYNHGGIYLDTDVELVKPLDFLLEHKAYMGFEKGRKVNTGHGFGAEKGHPVIRGNLAVYESMTFPAPGGDLDAIACPEITTAYLETLGLQREDRIQDLGEIMIYPQEYFCPMLLMDGEAEVRENTVTIHHYTATWKSPEEKAALHKRFAVYAKYGKTALSVYDGWMLLRKQGVGAFWKRFTEKFLSKAE